MNDPGRRYQVGPANHGQRLDRFLAERIPVSRSRLQQAIRTRVRLSWSVPVTPATRVRAGGEVVFGFAPIVEVEREDAIPVLTRGEGWLAVDKPAGMPVHPMETIRVNSLIHMVRRIEGQDRLRLVHRLDRETSGALLLAADRATAASLSGAFEDGRVAKEYLAVVHGRPAQDQGVVDWPICRDTDSPVRHKLVARPPHRAGEDARQASTRWRVEQEGRGSSLLRVWPSTGRRHQIRVHLTALGHPLVGDLLYGRPAEDYLALAREGRDVRRERGEPRRHLLHCTRLTFPDPRDGRPVEVVAPLPPGFGTFVQ